MPIEYLPQYTPIRNLFAHVFASRTAFGILQGNFYSLLSYLVIYSFAPTVMHTFHCIALVFLLHYYICTQAYLFSDLIIDRVLSYSFIVFCCIHMHLSISVSTSATFDNRSYQILILMFWLILVCFFSGH